MGHHEFTVILDRVPGDEGAEALFEAGCDDAGIETRDGITLLHFDREAHTLGHALVTAVWDAERAGFRVQGIETDDLVPLATIAERLGRSYEGLRLLASGRRGPGGFPAPLSSSGWSLYSWSQVIDWSTRHLNARSVLDRFEVELAAVNHIVRARNMLRDNADRAELSQLLA